MTRFNNSIICAIDTRDLDHAKDLVSKVKGKVGAVKLGLEFFVANGTYGVMAIKELAVPIFLDLKFHDIPNTVAGAVEAAVALGIDILTVHSLGGKEMMRACLDSAHNAAQKYGVSRPLIVGVTVLTSMNDDDLKAVGIEKQTAKQVELLASLVKECGLDGVVCSAKEVKLVKENCGVEFKTIVPGIRPVSSLSNDQKRIMTPKQAIKEGADFLVIGRPITDALDVGKAALDIVSQLQA